MKEPNQRRKACFVAGTILILLAVSCCSVWMIDGAVQIDSDFPVLALFLIAVNLVLGHISLRIYRALFSSRRESESEGRFHE